MIYVVMKRLLPQNWDCQDPCLYSCDHSIDDTSICKVLNRRTGEIGRCGLEISEGGYAIGCWNTPDECDQCAKGNLGGQFGPPCWRWGLDDCPRPRKMQDTDRPQRPPKYDYYEDYDYDKK